jgi:hypothetical protein
MASEGSSNTAMVIIFLVIVLAIAGFFVYRGGYFTGGDKVNVDVKVPSATAPSSP